MVNAFACNRLIHFQRFFIFVVSMLQIPYIGAMHSSAETEKPFALCMKDGFDILQFDVSTSNHVQELSITDVKNLSWSTLQKNILNIMPQLRMLVVDCNSTHSLQGTCALTHQNLEKVHINHTGTNTIGVLNLPNAHSIDLSYNMLQAVDTSMITCKSGAHLFFVGNVDLQKVTNTEDIIKRGLCIDLSRTPISGESFKGQLSQRLSTQLTLINAFEKRKTLFAGTVSWLLLRKVFDALVAPDPNYRINLSDSKDHLCLSIIIGLFVGSRILKAYAYGDQPRAVGPQLLITCDDAYFYADNTIQEKSQVPHGSMMPWYLAGKNESHNS